MKVLVLLSSHLWLHISNITFFGNLFFETFVNTLKIEQISLSFITPYESRVNTLRFAALKEKDYTYFSYSYTIKVKRKIYFTPNAFQVIHFPIQPTLPITFHTSKNDIMFPSTPHPNFKTRSNFTFNFLQVHQNPTKTLT